MTTPLYDDRMTNEGPSRAGTLETGLDVIELLASSKTSLGVSDIANQLHLDKGNTHRLLKVLQARGYIQQDPETRRYRPTAHLVGLAGAILRDIDLRSAAEAPCDELLAATGESVHAAQLTSEGIVYVLQRRGLHRVSVNTEVGATAPLHATASGKAVLAFLPEERLRALVQEPLERFTSRTHGSFEDLVLDLELVRRRGYAVDDEELNHDVRCVAAPVFDINGEVYGSIGVSGPTQRIGVNQVLTMATRVVEAAIQATSTLGGPIEAFGQAGQLHATVPEAPRELGRGSSGS